MKQVKKQNGGAKLEEPQINHYSQIVDTTLSSEVLDDDLLSLLDSKINFLNESEVKLNLKISKLTNLVSQKKKQSIKYIEEAQLVQVDNESLVREMQATLATSYEPCIQVSSKLQELHTLKESHQKIITYAQLFQKLQHNNKICIATLVQDIYNLNQATSLRILHQRASRNPNVRDAWETYVQSVEDELKIVVTKSLDHKLPQLCQIYEELDLGDRFIESYMEAVINQSKSAFDQMDDPDAIDGLDLQEFALGIFIPKAQQLFLKEMPRIEAIVAPQQVVNVQSKFIQQYMKIIFEELILKNFISLLIDDPENYEDEVMKVAATIGIVIESLKPTLNECQKQVVETLFNVYTDLVGTQFGKDYDPKIIALRFRKMLQQKL